MSEPGKAMMGTAVAGGSDRATKADDAHVIYGTAYDETLGDPLRVTVIANMVQPQAQMLRTGTDNLPILQGLHQGHSQPQSGLDNGTSANRQPSGSISTMPCGRSGLTASIRT